MIADWKTGRGVHCLSQGEALWYYVLRWDDTNEDIREQFPLDMPEVDRIADEMGIARPKSPNFVMTTDFLVTKSDGKLVAYSVKNDRNLTKRTLELLCVEKAYWLSKGIPFELLFKEDVNRIFATNIRLVTEFYDKNKVFDELSNWKHLIATKQIEYDMEKEIITVDKIRKLIFKQED